MGGNVARVLSMKNGHKSPFFCAIVTLVAKPRTTYRWFHTNCRNALNNIFSQRCFYGRGKTVLSFQTNPSYLFSQRRGLLKSLYKQTEWMINVEWGKKMEFISFPLLLFSAPYAKKVSPKQLVHEKNHTICTEFLKDTERMLVFIQCMVKKAISRIKLCSQFPFPTFRNTQGTAYLKWWWGKNLFIGHLYKFFKKWSESSHEPFSNRRLLKEFLGDGKSPLTDKTTTKARIFPKSLS